MNRVAQYRPSFVEDPAPLEIVQAATLAELEAIPFVARWKDRRHHHFAVSEDALLRSPWGGPDLRALMSFRDDGKTWFVVAGLENPDLYGLPVWR